MKRANRVGGARKGMVCSGVGTGGLCNNQVGAGAIMGSVRGDPFAGCGVMGGFALG